jgi:hypothetical protein|tara:strand:+ start:2200 stop:2532 length:333 start_codon:yes stop_codon:yes gene_type:complete
MPLYEFINKETGETFDKLMKIADKEVYLKKNPQIQQHYTSVPSIVRGSGSTNVDNHGFKEVLQKVGEAHPAGSVAADHHRATSKELKTRAIIKKHGAIQAKAEVARKKRK